MKLLKNIDQILIGWGVSPQAAMAAMFQTSPPPHLTAMIIMQKRQKSPMPGFWPGREPSTFIFLFVKDMNLSCANVPS